MLVHRYALLLGLGFALAACSGGAKTETPASKKSGGGDESDEDSDDDGKKKADKKPKQPSDDQESLSTDTETGTDTDTGTDTETETQTDPQQANEPAKEPPKLLTVYRFFKVGLEHFYTMDMGEGTNAGYTLESVGFKVLETAIDNAIPIYRCIGNSRHFVSLDPACEGKTFEGRYGYVMNGKRDKTKELVRCHNATATDFLATTPGECQTAGYTTEGPLGFAPEDGFVP